jgi:hypothetical protein
MTATDDLSIQVRKALAHANGCGTCAEMDAANPGTTNTGSNPAGGPS